MTVEKEGLQMLQNARNGMRLLHFYDKTRNFARNITSSSYRLFARKTDKIPKT